MHWFSVFIPVYSHKFALFMWHWIFLEQWLLFVALHALPMVSYNALQCFSLPPLEILRLKFIQRISLCESSRRMLWDLSVSNSQYSSYISLYSIQNTYFGLFCCGKFFTENRYLDNFIYQKFFWGTRSIVENSLKLFENFEGENVLRVLQVASSKLELWSLESKLECKTGTLEVPSWKLLLKLEPSKRLV